MQFIDLKAQYKRLQSDIDARMKRVLEHGQFIMGPEVFELEDKLCDYTGTRHCITVSSGTDALLASLMALEIEPNDEVIIPGFSFFATAEVVALIKAKPVFVDIDPHTYNIDPIKVKKAISPNTKAIIAVSLFGQCSDMDTLNDIANKHQIAVIEDAAQSFGATYKERKSCNLSSIGCTSFFPSKPLGCYGDGGAIFTNDSSLAEVLKEVRVHGQSERYLHSRIGLNARLDTLQAAVLLAKLTSFDAEISARQEVAAHYYKQLIQYFPSITTPSIAEYNSSVFGQFTVRTQNRDSLQKAFRSADIPTAVHYPIPLHKQPGINSNAYLPNAESAANSVLSLPMHPYMSKSDVDRVISAIPESFYL